MSLIKLVELDVKIKKLDCNHWKIDLGFVATGTVKECGYIAGQ